MGRTAAANEIAFSFSTVNGRMAPVVAEISRDAGLWLWSDSTSYLPSKRPLYIMMIVTAVLPYELGTTAYL